MCLVYQRPVKGSLFRDFAYSVRGGVLTQQTEGCYHDPIRSKLDDDTLPRCDRPSIMSVG